MKKLKESLKKSFLHGQRLCRSLEDPMVKKNIAPNNSETVVESFKSTGDLNYRTR